MARLTLHAGGFKTGSTAIQAYLLANRDAIGAQGILLPATGADRGGRHLPLVRALTSRDVSPRLAAAPAAFAAELARTPDRDAVISCESLEESLVETLPFFRSLGREVRVILYVRHQPPWLNSGYVQESRMLRASNSFADYVVRTVLSDRLRYSTWLSRAAPGTGEIVFRPYAGAVRDDAIGDFLSVAGIDAGSLPPTRDTRRNVSMSAVGVAALRLLARLARARGVAVSVAVRNQIIREAEGADAALGLPPFQGFDAAAFDHVTRQFGGDNAWFAHRIWNRPWTDVFAADLAVAAEPTEIDLDAEPTPEFREARRLFRTLRPRFMAAAEPVGGGGDDLPDLGSLLPRKRGRVRAPD